MSTDPSRPNILWVSFPDQVARPGTETTLHAHADRIGHKPSDDASVRFRVTVSP